MNGFDLSTISSVYVGSTQYNSIYYGSTKVWPVTTQHNYANDYFTIESLQDSNTISLVKVKNCSISPTIYYSTDDGNTWSSVSATSTTTNITTINTGDKLLLRSTNNNLAITWDTYNKLNCSKNFKVYGNVMSLLFGNNFQNQVTFNNNTTHNLAGLFYGVTTLTDASDLILPATTLNSNCYNCMFRGCTNLVNGPKLLPALDVPVDAYSSMFEGCVKLVEGPEILATTVSGNTALNRMFCMNRNSKVTSAMTKSPILRVTNPGDYSNVYQQLFCGNGNITEVTILAVGTGLTFNNWLSNVATGGVIKKLSATTLVSGNNGIPSSWTTTTYTQS